jgi:non-ribosomal peptide synthetase component F
LRPLPIQYADFASWQRQWRSHPEVTAQLDYWCEQLCDSVPAISLSVSRSKRAADELDIACREVTLSASLTQALKEFSHREAGTLFMALLAGLQTLIHRTTGEVDPRVATNVANRNRPGTEGLIGPLVNTLILRTHLGGDPNAREIMRRVRATTLAAYAHQDLPFEELAATLAQEHGLDPAELSRVMILLQNATLRPLARSDKAFTFEEANPGMPMPLVTTTTYDVILVLRENGGGLMGSCIYKPHLFSGASIGRLLRGFRNVLEFMTAHPDRPISAMRVSLNGKPLKS